MEIITIFRSCLQLDGMIFLRKWNVCRAYPWKSLTCNSSRYSWVRSTVMKASTSFSEVIYVIRYVSLGFLDLPSIFTSSIPTIFVKFFFRTVHYIDLKCLPNIPVNFHQPSLNCSKCLPCISPFFLMWVIDLINYSIGNHTIVNLSQVNAA